jgi:hypothetical protein
MLLYLYIHIHFYVINSLLNQLEIQLIESFIQITNLTFEVIYVKEDLKLISKAYKYFIYLEKYLLNG